jgi:DNA-directed RNA polymerase subunit H (RpoH/RPB5)
LQYNVIDHILVPKHTKVEDSTLDIYKRNLPSLLTTDPICRYYNFQPGDIIKISRSIGGIDYRVVRHP